MKKNQKKDIENDGLKKNNRKEFEKIYSDYYNKICVFLSGYSDDQDVIEDVTQDVFLKIWSNRNTINLTTSLSSYLYKTAYNTLMSDYRVLKKKNNMLSSYYYTALIQALETDEDHKTFQLKKLDNCIENLPQRTKEVFHENKIAGLKYQQVADKLNISIKTVEGHISRALSYLRACMN